MAGAAGSEVESYELKSVDIPIRFDEFVDVAIYHPF
jgi:hypothetical protein